MSDFSISIVPKQSTYPDKENKVKEILEWLISLDIIKPASSDCVLGSNEGYAISNNAKKVTTHSEYEAFALNTNGLEIITNRQIFHTKQNGIEKLICPNCLENIANEDWNFLDVWAENLSNNLTCPLCRIASDIHQFNFLPEWGFSDLGFTFWNWPDLTKAFINDFRQKLGCDINLIYTHL